jgi:hypothetical protein
MVDKKKKSMVDKFQVLHVELNLIILTKNIF